MNQLGNSGLATAFERRSCSTFTLFAKTHSTSDVRHDAVYTHDTTAQEKPTLLQPSGDVNASGRAKVPPQQ